MIFYLNLCQTLNKFSWANSVITKSITRSAIFASIGKNERCKICLLLIFQRLSRGHFQRTKYKEEYF